MLSSNKPNQTCFTAVQTETPSRLHRKGRGNHDTRPQTRFCNLGDIGSFIDGLGDAMYISSFSGKNYHGNTKQSPSIDPTVNRLYRSSRSVDNGSTHHESLTDISRRVV